MMTQRTADESKAWGAPQYSHPACYLLMTKMVSDFEITVPGLPPFSLHVLVFQCHSFGASSDPRSNSNSSVGVSEGERKTWIEIVIFRYCRESE